MRFRTVYSLAVRIRGVAGGSTGHAPPIYGVPEDRAQGGGDVGAGWPGRRGGRSCRMARWPFDPSRDCLGSSPHASGYGIPPREILTRI